MHQRCVISTNVDRLYRSGPAVDCSVERLLVEYR